MIDLWFPTSKTCSVCGEIKRYLKPNKRKWGCSGSRMLEDRDVNAAISILDKAVSPTISSCGEEPDGLWPCLRGGSETLFDEAGTQQFSCFGRFRQVWKSGMRPKP